MRNAHRLLVFVSATVLVAEAVRLLGTLVALWTSRPSSARMLPARRSSTVKVGLRHNSWAVSSHLGARQPVVAADDRRLIATTGSKQAQLYGGAPFATLSATPHILHVGQAVPWQEDEICGPGGTRERTTPRASHGETSRGNDGRTSACGRQRKLVPIGRATQLCIQRHGEHRKHPGKALALWAGSRCHSATALGVL